MKTQFWYAVKTITQPSLLGDGRTVSRDIPVGEGHIVYNEVLLCKQSRDALKKKLKAEKHKTVGTRLANVPICRECQDWYKGHPDMAWARWVNSAPRQTEKIAWTIRQENQEKE